MHDVKEEMELEKIPNTLNGITLYPGLTKYEGRKYNLRQAAAAALSPLFPSSV